MQEGLIGLGHALIRFTCLVLIDVMRGIEALEFQGVEVWDEHEEESLEGIKKSHSFLFYVRLASFLQGLL
jgi:hypothetical protein